MSPDLYLRIPSPWALTFPGLTAHTRLCLAQGDVLRVPLKILPYEGPIPMGPPIPGPPSPKDLIAPIARFDDVPPWMDDPLCSLDGIQRWLRGVACRCCPPDILFASLLGLPHHTFQQGTRRVRITLGTHLLTPLGIPNEAWGEGILSPECQSFVITEGPHEGRPTTSPDLTAGYGDPYDIRLDHIVEHLFLSEIDLAAALQRAPHAQHAVLRLARILNTVVSTFSLWRWQ